LTVSIGNQTIALCIVARLWGNVSQSALKEKYYACLFVSIISLRHINPHLLGRFVAQFWQFF